MSSTYFKTILLALGMTLACVTHAGSIGGVGSGGGGIINPDPSSPEEIAKTINDDSRYVIETWLNRQELNFWEQSPEVRALNPLRKLFETSPGIIQLMKSTEVELRMNQPCFDSNNQPMDGSIYGTKPGSLCLSPFTMAPKLSPYNYKAESYALLVHEFSHMLGANEAEAVAIQKIALRDFFAKNTEVLKDEGYALLNKIDTDITRYLASWILMPEVLQARTDLFRDLLRGYQEVQNAYNSDGARYLLVSRHEDGLHAAEFVRLEILDAFLCTQDSRLDDFRRSACNDTLERAFDGNTSASIETIMKNLSLYMYRVNPDIARSTIVQKPTSWAIFVEELKVVRLVYSQIQNNLAIRIGAPLKTYPKLP